MSDWMEAERHADRALDMFERGRWAEAELELRKALALNPEQPEWHFNLGLTLEAAGRDVEAIVCYERAAELSPEQAESMVAAAAAANRLGRHERALEWCERALQLDPACETAFASRIEAHYRSGQHDEAETAFYLAQQALEEPGAQCLAAIAESLIDRGEFARAEWCLKEALRLEPQYPRLRARLASICRSTGRPQRAVQMFLRDLRDDPGNIDTLLEYGDLLVELGRLPEAAEKYRRILEVEPANVDAHFRLGRIALATRRFEQAYVEFELVYKLDGGFPEIRLALAETMLGRGNLQTARQFLREEIADRRTAQEPDIDAELADRLGTLLLRAELSDDATRHIRQAIELGGETPERLRRLAVARFRAGDRDGGAAASRRALRLDPECVASMHNLALAALEEGQIRTASGWIARGLAQAPHDDGLRRLRMRVWLAGFKAVMRRVRALVAARRTGRR